MHFVTCNTELSSEVVITSKRREWLYRQSVHSHNQFYHPLCLTAVCLLPIAHYLLIKMKSAKKKITYYSCIFPVYGDFIGLNILKDELAL